MAWNTGLATAEIALWAGSSIVSPALQIGCREKAAKINCLRKALNRSKLSNANLKDLLNDLKSREWISDEAHSVLSVK